MKKLISILLACAMTLTQAAMVMAEETATTVFDYDFTSTTTQDAWNAETTAEGTAWTLAGNKDAPKHSGSYLNMGHVNVAETKIVKDLSQTPVGADYTYDITLKANAQRHLSTEHLKDGSYYSAMTVINNGGYELGFTIEADGIYGYNSENKWTKLWSGSALSETDYAKFTAKVNGDDVILYKNNTEVIKYELPKSTEAASYYFGTKGISGQTNINTFVTEIVLVNTSTDVATPDALLNLGLETEENIGTFLEDTTWTKEGTAEKLLNNKTSLKFEGNAAVKNLGISKAMSVGGSYLYEFDLVPHGTTTNNRFVGTNDAIGDYYTAKSEITNGRYKMAFSVEKDGIYALDETGVLTKMYEGTPPADANGNYQFATYSVAVNGDKATVSRDGAGLFTYTMPSNLEEGKYSLGLNRNTDNAIFYAKNIKLYNYSAAQTETALINLNFAEDTTVDAEWSCAGWTVVPTGTNFSPKHQYGKLNVGHPWVVGGKANISTNTFASPIGMAYKYDITVAGVADRMISAAELDDGELYTAKTVINNGAYELNFTIEADGIYGYNKDGEWTVLYNGEALTTTMNSFTAIVEGANATIYKNDEKLFSYELAKSLTADSYFYGAQGVYSTTPANSQIQSITLSSLDNNETAPTALVNLGLTTADEITAFKNDTSWTVTGSANKLLDATGSMQLVGNNHSTLEINKELSEVGTSYVYQFDALPMGTTSNYRFATTANITKDYYTIGSTVKNGANALQFSVEYDGVYALNSDGTYTKIYDGMPPADANGNWVWATYSVIVNGNKATILRDGAKLGIVTMPENAETPAYKFGKSTPGSYEGNFYVKNIKLYSYPAIADDTQATTQKHINLVFNANDENGTFTGLVDNANWTLEKANSNGLRVEGGNLALGQAYVLTPSMSTTFFAKPIGKTYTYKLDVTGRWADRLIGDACLTDGSYYTVKTKITNGTHKLELTFEETGVYGYDSTNTWTKLYPQSGDSWSALYSSLTTNTMTVQVKGKNATILRDGVKLFTYTMPQTTETDSYLLAASGKSATYGEFGQIYVNNISLTSDYSQNDNTSLNASYAAADGKLTVTVAEFNENINSGDAYTIIVAAYNSNKEMTAVDFAEIDENTADETIEIAYAGTENVLIFVWDEIGAMAPLSEVLGLSDIE